MGRKSTIHKLEPEVRSYIEKLLRADQLTLDEMITELQQKFPIVSAITDTSKG